MQLGFSLSNRQKVQLITNLLKWRTRVFIHNANVQLKVNEIKVIKVWLKMRLNIGEALINKGLEKTWAVNF